MFFVLIRNKFELQLKQNIAWQVIAAQAVKELHS